MQASVTGRIAASAKVQTPVARLLGIRCGDDAQSRAWLSEPRTRKKLGRSGNVVGVPPEPFPSPPGAIESQQGFIVRGIAPIGARWLAGFLRVLLGHGSASSRRVARGIQCAERSCSTICRWGEWLVAQMRHGPREEVTSDTRRYWCAADAPLPSSTGDCREIGVIVRRRGWRNAAAQELVAARGCVARVRLRFRQAFRQRTSRSCFQPLSV